MRVLPGAIPDLLVLIPILLLILILIPFCIMILILVLVLLLLLLLLLVMILMLFLILILVNIMVNTILILVLILVLLLPLIISNRHPATLSSADRNSESGVWYCCEMLELVIELAEVCPTFLRPRVAQCVGGMVQVRPDSRDARAHAMHMYAAVGRIRLIVGFVA